VEVLGRYSNLPDQGERVRHILEIVPEDSTKVNARAQKQPQHRLTPEETERLKRTYEAGATLRDLAREFQIHRTTAADLLERSGVFRRVKGPSEVQMSEAIRMYLAGQSAARIGQALGFAADTIRYRLKAAGVQMRGPHDWHARG
jgi:DNA-binding CsgD family transcriptional regulator